jgi:riboflavin synthase
MFTGIIENLGQIAAITPDGGNVHFDVTSTLAPELKIDQSVAHDGCCLTVVALHGEGVPHGFRVTAIAETLDKTCLGTWTVGRSVNLERAALVGSRLDGHTVQGHVDSVGRVTEVSETNGSWRVAIEHPAYELHRTVPKGSITLNGVSLTVVDSGPTHFSVALIPYTWEHTNLSKLKVGDPVNLEFDVLGKYVLQYLRELGSLSR